jgi:uncharacterized protein YfiM (DUF2279 family)
MIIGTEGLTENSSRKSWISAPSSSVSSERRILCLKSALRLEWQGRVPARHCNASRRLAAGGTRLGTEDRDDLQDRRKPTIELDEEPVSAAAVVSSDTFIGGARAQSARKTFVLVPGAFLGAWVWRRVSDLLEKQGHKVYSLTLTGLGDRSHLLSKDINLDTHRTGRYTMRNHDFVSSWFLAITAASFMLLCSSLLVIAFI